MMCPASFLNARSQIVNFFHNFYPNFSGTQTGGGDYRAAQTHKGAVLCMWKAAVEKVPNPNDSF